MRKFLPGGRCSSSNTCVKEDTSQTGKAFSQLMAARDAQDRMWTQPPTTPIPSNTPSQAIVIVKEEQKPPNKKDLISTILNGDM